MSPKQVIAKYQPSILRRFVLFCAYVFGIVLHLVGLYNPTKYMHILWLAHYLLRSGKTRYMILCEEDYKQVLERIKYVSDNRYFTAETGTSLFNAIGKARFKIVKNMLVVVDYYKFYACDNDADSHGYYQISNRARLMWNDIDVPLPPYESLVKLWSKIPKRIQRLAIFFAITHSKENMKTWMWARKHPTHDFTLRFNSKLFSIWNIESNDEDDERFAISPLFKLRISKAYGRDDDKSRIESVSLEVSDRFFAPLGKPFLTVGRFGLPEHWHIKTVRDYFREDY